MTNQVIGRKLKGFAAMAPGLLRVVSSRGGIAAHKSGKAHRFDSDEAKKAAASRHMALNRREADMEAGTVLHDRAINVDGAGDK